MKRQLCADRYSVRGWFWGTIMLLAAAGPAAGQVELDWLATFNGAGSYREELHDLALGDGCIYVTGFSYVNWYLPKFTTVKYDQAGREQWVRIYGPFNGPNDAASAEAVATDASGNVFVTGRSAQFISDSEHYVDAATLKYDAAGNLLWAHRYRSAGRNNQPLDVAVDRAGNAYVAGASWDGTGYNLMLLKYSPAGALLWDRTVGDEDARVWDAGYAVAIDPSGNPVVGGYSHSGYPSYGYLVKFSPEGQLLWERRRVSYNVASAWWRVVINEAGRIYAYGEIAPPGDGYHLWTAQYDTEGNLIWEQNYDGNARGSNFRGGIALTPAGGVVMSGHSADFDSNGGVSNIVTIRYEPDGREVWRRLSRGGYAQAGGRDVAVDRAGNAYVTGFGFNENENMDFVTLKYAPEGKLRWTQVYAGRAGFTDWPGRIAVDSAGGVIVAGDTHGDLENYYDYATIRYRQTARGDLNCDGAVDFGDVNPFVLAISDPEEYQRRYPDCDINNADCNEDGAIDFGDINPFVELLGG